MIKGIITEFSLMVENRIERLLWLVFAASILTKIFIIPLLGAAWFPYSDEHLYIELAKNIYYHQNLLSNVFPNIRQYNEFLFPLLLSPLYIFYSPENMLSVFRIFGLFVMSTAVFPAYKLGLAILNNKNHALLIALFAILIPEMTLAFTVIQEVIYYPLFLFTIYLIYQRIAGKRINSVYLGFMLFLLWNGKAVGATVFVGYILYLFCYSIFIDHKNFKTYFSHALVVIVVVLGLKELSSLIIRYANFGSFVPVADFYTNTAISRLNNGLGTFISDFPNGILYYVFFTTIIFMIFPLILPLGNFRQYDFVNRKFLLFLFICLVTTMATVVVLVYMDEGGATREVQRVHYRYLFPYFIPYLVLMLKIDFSRLKLGQMELIFSSFIVIYYLLFQPKFTNGSTIDAKSLLLIETIQNRMVNGFNIIFIVIVIISTFLGYIIYKNTYGITSKKLLIWIIGVALLISQAYATYDTYHLYATELNGITRKLEYSSLSKLVNTKLGTPLLIDLNGSLWLDVLYTTQSNKGFIVIFSSENPLEYFYDPSITPNFLITSKNFSTINKIQNVKLVDTNLKLFNVYQLTEAYAGKIKFDYIMLNTYADNWLMDNAKLLIAGDEGKNQVEVSLNLITDEHVSDIVATLTDSTGKVSLASVSPNGEMVSIIVNKKPEEKFYELRLGSNNYFIPAELGLGADTRKLTYKVTAVEVK